MPASAESARVEWGVRRRALAGVLAASASLCGLIACAPKAPPLTGVIAPVRIPDTRLPPVYEKIVFNWEFSDGGFHAKGDGAARIAPPDSVRLDFFVANGLGGGAARLVGDSLVLLTSGGRVRDYLPPVPMIWAALGRLAVPAAADTVARVDGDTLRIEIGRNPAWRATFAGQVLQRLEVIDGGRIPERTTRDDDRHVRYERTGAHRSLDLMIVRTDTVPGFNATIWE